jgi:predicted negative regulator of RcsB-dependent stress response
MKMNEVPPINSGASESGKFRLWIILFVIVVIIAGISGFKYWISIPPREVVEADAGFKKAEKTINPEQLRAWALDEIQKYSVTNKANIP